MLKNLLKILILIASSTVAVSFAAAPTFSSSSTFSVAENTKFVAVVTATDSGNGIYYQLPVGGLGVFHQDLFLVDSASGTLTFKTAPDYENSTTTYTVFISATSDGGTPQTSDDVHTIQSINITVYNIDDPTDITIVDNMIDENAVVDAQVGTLSSTNLDAGGVSHTYTYSIIATQANNNQTILDEIQRIKNDPAITASDINIEIIYKAEEKIRNLNFVSYTDEELSKLKSIFTSDNADVSNGGLSYDYHGALFNFSADINLTIAPSNGTDGTFFNISDDLLRANGSLDFEAKNLYTIRINTNDGANNFSKDFVIRVNNKIETATFTIVTIADASIAENTDYSATIALTGDAPIGTVTYTLSGDDADDFSVGTYSGTVTISAKNFENPTDLDDNNIYTVILVATDNDGNNATQSWTITITDEVYESPSDIVLIGDIIDENAGVNAQVGTLSTTDDDSSVFTYSIIATHADNNKAVLDEIQRIKNDPNIPTSSINTQSDINIVRSARDKIKDLNFDYTYEELSKLKLLFTEGFLYGVFIYIHPTSLGALFFDFSPNTNIITTYDGIDGTFFNIFNNLLRANEDLDFEFKSSYNIRINTNDGVNDFSKDFTITVNNDANEAPVITSANIFSVLEKETLVINLSATSEDSSAVTFSVVDGANASLFTLTTAGVLTFDTPAYSSTAVNIYTIQALAANNNGTTTQVITINVITKPTFSVATNTITLTENAPETISHPVDINNITNLSGGNYTFAVSSSGGIFSTNPAAVVSFSDTSTSTTAALSSTAQTATLYFTIIPDTTGAGTITITLTDENSNVTTKTLTVVVTESDTSPVISQDIATYVDAITDTISRKYNYQNDAAIFGGSLYFSLNNGGGANFADFIALQSSFNTDAHIAIIDSEQERLFFNTLSGGSFDAYLGIASGTETGFGIAGSVDSWYSVLGDFILFDSTPNTPNIGEQIAPGHYDFSFNGGNSGAFADNNAIACLRYQDNGDFNDRPCNDVGGGAIDDGFFELPSGLPALNQASFTLSQTDTFTQVATLSGFDLDGDNITWSYSDSVDGTATFTNNSAANTGVISTTVDYQPAVGFVGTTTLSIILTDSNNNSATMTINITVDPAAPDISLSTTTITATARSAISNITVTNSGGDATYSISPAIDNALSFDTTDGTISGTPANVATNVVYTVTATNVTNSDSATLSITVNPAAPIISLSVSTLTATAGTAISNITVTNSGGDATYSISPAIDNALSFDTTDGTISGTPANAATNVVYTVTATNVTNSDSATLSITVNPAAPIISLSVSTLTATAGTAISNITVTNSGGDATYSISPAIDNALSFDTTDGTISGTPANAATNVVWTITASNVSGNSTATLNITVNPAAPDISLSTTTVVASVATAITAITVSNDGGTATYSISPVLSEGLSFATNTGTISGTPSATATLQVYTITASNVTNSDSATLSITVNLAAPSIELSVDTVNAGIRAIANITVINTGGTATYSISPAITNGLSFNTTTGTISGTPSATATAIIYTVTATNISGTDSASVSITVSQVTIAPSIEDITNTQTYFVGVAISPVVFTNAGDLAQSCVSNPDLPAGLNAVVSGDSCAINGEAEATKTLTTYTITATNLFGSDTATINIAVTLAIPNISLSTTTITAIAGSAINNITVTNNGGDATYSISPAIDNGLSFDTADGTISGTPANAATNVVWTITASNISGNSTATVNITVNPAAPDISLSTTTVVASVATAITAITVSNDGGTATYSISPALSEGLSFATNTGTISGTPSITATLQVYTITASNVTNSDSATLSITVNAVIAFSLDVDGNQTLSSSNDGLVIFKYLLNPNANNLHTTIANDAIESRKTSAQLKAYLDSAATILDVDGNGSFTAYNDGLIIFKYLLNPNSNNLHTTIASDAIEGRKTTADLKAYLDKFR